MSGHETLGGGIHYPSAIVGSPEPLGVPFSRFASVIRRRAWLILSCFLVVTVATAVIVHRATPRYTAVTSILIESRRTQVSDLQASSSEPENAPNIMRTQIDILRSPDLAQGVVKALDLINVPEFMPQESASRAAINRVLVSLGLIDEAPLVTNNNTLLQIAAGQLLNKISFNNETRSNVLRVAVETEDPQLSAQITNELTRQFLEFKRFQKFSATQRAHEWFQERLRELAVRAREAEQEVQEFRAKSGLAEVPTANGAPSFASMNAQQMIDVNRYLAQLIVERTRLESRIEEMRAAMQQGKPEAVPGVLQSPLYQQLREQEVALAGREAEIATTIGDRGPDLMAMRSKRRGVQRRIQEEMANITTGLVSEVQAVRMQEDRLRAKLADLREKVVRENTAEVRLHSHVAEARASRSIYESFLGRATQLANVAGIQEPDAELVSTATPPLAPSAPKKGRITAVAAALSLVLGLVLAFLVERMRTGFGTPEDVESRIGLVPLGLVPRISLRQGKFTIAGRDSFELLAALSRIRGNLQVLDEERRPKVIMVTSALPKEGKSIFSLGLAESVAQAGGRVLLIDADMRRPALSRYVGLSPEPGLHRLLEEGATLGSSGSAVHCLPSGLHVMLTGTSRRNPQDLLASKRMSRLIKFAREEYDLVVIDVPPVLMVADPLLLARQVDAVILAVCWEKTPQAAVQQAVKLLHGSGTNMLGSVLTQVNLRRFAAAGGGAFAHMARNFRHHYAPPPG